MKKTGERKSKRKWGFAVPEQWVTGSRMRAYRAVESGNSRN